MKKVCFIILGLEFSGAENVLVQYLDRSEVVDPFFITVYNGPVNSILREKYGTEKVYCADLRYRKNYLRFIPGVEIRQFEKKAKPILQRITPDVIYANNTLELMLSKLIVKETSVPCICHIHDMMNHYGTVFKIRETKKAFPYYKELITVSSACRRSWNNDRFKVVYNGVPKHFLYGGEQLPKSFTIGFAGMLCDRKGFDLVCNAIDECDASVKWAIAYNIIHKGYEKRVDELKGKQNVTLYEKLSNVEMPSFYNSISMLVIPSRADPLPTVAIEAMGSSRLVIGSDVDGIPELLAYNNEVLFDPQSAAGLSNKIAEVLSWSAEKIDLVRRDQHNYCLQNFCIEQKVQKIDSIIEQTV